MLEALVCATMQMSDGDSGRCDGRRFRLAGIDAPEVQPFTRCRQRPDVWACSPRARPFGPAAAERARGLTRNGARCETTGGSSYGRAVVRCYVNGRDLGETLIREGLAISDPTYGTARYRAVESEARRAGRGVWE